MAVRLLAMRRKIRGLWPVAAIAAITAGAGWLLYKVWRSPHRNDLIAYWGLVATVVTIAAGWIAWAWRARTGKTGGALEAPVSDHLADVLARAVMDQWTSAAADRGLLVPDPIPVRWRRPSVPLAGPAAAAAGARRFQPLPGLLEPLRRSWPRETSAICTSCTEVWGRAGCHRRRARVGQERGRRAADPGSPGSPGSGG